MYHAKKWMSVGGSFRVVGKQGCAPSLERGSSVACDDLGIAQRYVVYPGTERFPPRHDAMAPGLREMSELLRQ